MYSRFLESDEEPNATERELWHDFIANKAQSARQALIQFYLPFVKKIAAHIYSMRTMDDVDFDDYVQFGVVGMIESIDRFDPKFEVSFTTYASYRVKGSIYSGLVQSTERRTQSSHRNKILSERINCLLQQEERSGLFEQLVDITISLAMGYVLDSLGNAKEFQPSKDASPYQQKYFAQLKGRLDGIVVNLSPLEFAVIKYHYYHQVRFDQVAEILELSKGRISQIHKKALQNIRSQLENSSTLAESY